MTTPLQYTIMFLVMHWLIIWIVNAFFYKYKRALAEHRRISLKFGKCPEGCLCWKRGVYTPSNGKFVQGTTTIEHLPSGIVHTTIHLTPEAKKSLSISDEAYKAWKR